MSQLKSITDDALVQAYYEAPVVEDLIDRLAIDNRTTRQQVRRALEALGCMPPEEPRAKEAPKKRGPKTRIDYAKAKELYDRGLSDLKIGRALGLSQNTILNWRKNNGLPSHAQIVEAERGSSSPQETHSIVSPGGHAAQEQVPDPRQQPEPEANEEPLTLGEFRSVQTAYLPAALNDAELYLDGRPLLSVPQIITSWGDGVPRVDVQTRRGR